MEGAGLLPDPRFGAAPPAGKVSRLQELPAWPSEPGGYCLAAQRGGVGGTRVPGTKGVLRGRETGKAEEVRAGHGGGEGARGARWAALVYSGLGLPSRG